MKFDISPGDPDESEMALEKLPRGADEKANRHDQRRARDDRPRRRPRPVKR
jgi:hypothetical protein